MGDKTTKFDVDKKEDSLDFLNNKQVYPPHIPSIPFQNFCSGENTFEANSGQNSKNKRTQRTSRFMHGGPANNSILCNSRVCHTHRNSSSNVSSVIDHSTPPLYPSPQKNIRCIHFSIDIQYFYHFIHLHYIHTGSIRRVKVLDLPYCWLLESPCWSHLPSSQVASLTKKRGGGMGTNHVPGGNSDAKDG